MISEADAQEQQRRSLLASVSADVAGRRIRTGLRGDDLCGTLIPRPDLLKIQVAGFRARGEADLPVRSNSTRFLAYFFLGKK